LNVLRRVAFDAFSGDTERPLGELPVEDAGYRPQVFHEFRIGHLRCACHVFLVAVGPRHVPEQAEACALRTLAFPHVGRFALEVCMRPTGVPLDDS
jgi:hypothetical protein